MLAINLIFFKKKENVWVKTVGQNPIQIWADWLFGCYFPPLGETVLQVPLRKSLRFLFRHRW